MMKTFIKSAVLLCMVLLGGCRHDDDPSAIDLQLQFTPSIFDVESKASATRSSFAQGDKMGLYITQWANQTPRELLGSGNIYDNQLFTCQSDGTFTGTPLFYPSRRDKIDVYAYVPYSATLAEKATAYPLTVSAVQTDATIKDEDFLVARSLGNAAPTTSAMSAIPLNFKHMLCKVVVVLRVPKGGFNGKTITSASLPTIPRVIRGATVDLSKAHIYTAGGIDVVEPDITMRQDGAAVDNGELETVDYTFEALVVPQSIEPGKQLFQVLLNYSNDLESERFSYKSTQVRTYSSGEQHTMVFEFSDFGSMELMHSEIIPWYASNVNGTIGGEGMANTFKINIIEPVTDYSTSSTIKKASLTITEEGGEAKIYNFSQSGKAPVLSGDILVPIATFSIPADDGFVPLKYPYTISKIELLGATDNALETADCNIVVANVGTIAIALEDYGAIAMTNSVTAWGGGTTPSGGLVDSQVSNPISLIYGNAAAIESTACSLVGKVVITVNSKEIELGPYVMKNFTNDGVVNHQFVTTSTVPVDVAGKTNVPTKYPYTITKVVLKKADNTVLYTSGALAIKVEQAGGVTLQVMQ